MQASKIKVKTVYAIQGEGEKLLRFRVGAIVTRKTQDGPQGYSSKIEGFVVPEDRAEGEAELLILSPERILGPYQEYTELKAREAAEQAVKDAEQQAKVAIVEEVRHLLYTVTGLDMPPEDTRSRSGIYRMTYGNGLDVGFGGVQALLPILRKLV